MHLSQKNHRAASLAPVLHQSWPDKISSIHDDLIEYSPFLIDPKATRAATLPAHAYANPALLGVEQEKIFRATWQYTASLDTPKHSGNFAARRENGARHFHKLYEEFLTR